jgi:tetratricopeptide (TPR) repeat protein
MRFAIPSLGLVVIVAAYAQQKPAEPPRFDHTVREDIFAGFNGDDDRLAKGIATCDAALKADPKNAEAMVWRGAARLFLGGQAFRKKDNANGLKLWTGGLKDMDEAVALDPKNPGVRIPRAAVMMASVRFVPESQKKLLLDKALDDFKTMYDLQKDSLDQLGTHPRGELHMGLADAYRLAGEMEKSKEQLNAVVKALPNTKYAERAKEWLAANDDAKLAHTCIGCHTPK